MRVAHNPRVTYRVLATKEMPPLERTCSECNATMQATGELYHDAMHGWFVVFRCPEQNQIVPVWAREYERLIQDLTRGVDPTTLPHFPPGG